MKKLTLALPLLFVSSTALAEPPPVSASPAAALDTPAAEPSTPAVDPASDEPVTLTGSRGLIKHSGWYVAPAFGATTLDGNFSSLVGLRGAWLINRQFGIGLAGNGFGWDRTQIDSPAPNSRVDGGYGGLLLQYIIASDKLVHGTIDATLGGGVLCYDVAASDRHRCDDRITFFVLEPTANVELNVTSFMRVAVGAGYRFTAIDENYMPGKPELGGFVTRTSLQFGQF